MNFEEFNMKKYFFGIINIIVKYVCEAGSSFSKFKKISGILVIPREF